MLKTFELKYKERTKNEIYEIRRNVEMKERKESLKIKSNLLRQWLYLAAIFRPSIASVVVFRQLIPPSPCKYP